MAEYIDKSKLETHEICEHGEWVEVVYMDDIKEEPTIDIVHCKDCKWYNEEDLFCWYWAELYRHADATPRITPFNYCFRGEQKESESPLFKATKEVKQRIVNAFMGRKDSREND